MAFFYIAYLPDYHKHAPGRQLMPHNIERAMSEGCTGFDFLQGGHEYKQKPCTGSLELMDAFICQARSTAASTTGCHDSSAAFEWTSSPPSRRAQAAAPATG